MSALCALIQATCTNTTASAVFLKQDVNEDMVPFCSGNTFTNSSAAEVRYTHSSMPFFRSTKPLPTVSY